jgi:two-component system nitrogen regulation response regulator NtrX
LGIPTVIASDVSEGLRLLADQIFAGCVLDLANGRAALTSLRLVRARHPALPVMGIVDPGNTVVAAEAMQAGLVDLLPWPFEPATLATMLEDSADRMAAPIPLLEDSAHSDDWVLQSVAMREVVSLAGTASTARQGVALMGEPGSGREALARVLHRRDHASSDSYAALDCAHQSPSQLECALFGATTVRQEGAADTPERVIAGSALATAAGGTLYLANLLQAPVRLQARLARVLRDREGVSDAGEPVEIDARIVASFDTPLEAAVADGRLRRDLADRFTVRVEVPPLRRRREDIPPLVVRLLADACVRHGVARKSVSRAALSLFAALPWPGNVSELAAVADSMARTVPRPVIQLDDVLEHASLEGLTARADTGLTLRQARLHFERECISAMLIRHHGRVGEAAKALGIQRTNLYRKVRQLKVARALLSAQRS